MPDAQALAGVSCSPSGTYHDGLVMHVCTCVLTLRGLSKMTWRHRPTCSRLLYCEEVDGFPLLPIRAAIRVGPRMPIARVAQSDAGGLC